MSAALDHARMEIGIDGVELGLTSLQRDGEGDSILFLHGFGPPRRILPTSSVMPGWTGTVSLPMTRPGSGIHIAATTEESIFRFSRRRLLPCSTMPASTAFIL